MHAESRIQLIYLNQDVPKTMYDSKAILYETACPYVSSTGNDTYAAASSKDKNGDRINCWEIDELRDHTHFWNQRRRQETFE